MKHAYLILAHTDFAVLEGLLQAIDDERNDIYVHFDKKVGTMPTLHTERASLQVLHDRVDVHWGDVSVVEAEYKLFEAAVSHGPYGYYHLLSGVDLPLKTQDYIHSFCDDHQGTEFVGYTLTSITPELERKVLRWHLFPRAFRCPTLWQRALRAAFLRLQEFLGIRRNRDIAFKKGSQWCSLTDEAARLLIDRKEWALRTFSHTFCADEIYKQTIIWNSPLYDHIYCTTDDGLGCMRAIGWRGSQLFDWTREDLAQLTASEALFARKFNSSDSDFLQQILALSASDARGSRPSQDGLSVSAERLRVSAERLSAEPRESHAKGSDRPKVSVIMPVYNAEDSLAVSLASLEAQTYERLEICLVDDHSTDGSLKQLETFQQQSRHNVVIRHHDSNRGAAAARNTGLDTVSGDYVCWLDADDRLEPEAIARWVAKAEAEELDIVGCEWRLACGESERYMKQAPYSTPQEALQNMMCGVMRWNLWLFLTRRSLIEMHQLRFTEGMDMGEDMAMMIRLFLHAHHVALLPTAFYHYSQTESSVSNGFSPRKIQQVTANVAVAQQAIADSELASQLTGHVDFLKQALKLPLLISERREDYRQWAAWFPESDATILQNRLTPLRTRLLQWCAAKKLWGCVWIYNKIVYGLLYGIVFK